MSIFGFIFIGLITGWLSCLISNSSGSGLLIELLVGVIGALLGGFVLHVFIVQVGGFFIGLVIAAISSILTLVLLSIAKYYVQFHKSDTKPLIT